jgi:outer membrane protein
MNKITLLALMMAFFVGASAQTKIAHLDGSKLLESMPEVKQAVDSVKAMNDMYVSEIGNMEKSLQEAYQKYQSEANTLPETIRASREQQIMQQQQGLEEVRQQAAKDLEELQRKLLEKPTERAKKAIEDVAKENGYTYVMDSSGQLILYAGGEDILDKVKTKLGIPLDAPKK